MLIGPRLDGISFLHRFGSALNHHVHLHACVTDGVFVPIAAEADCDAPPAFLPARPITHADLAALTERVRRRVIRWFRIKRLLDTAAAADMLTWENSGFSIDASVRITLIDRDDPSYFQSLDHLLRSCAQPPFALERLSVTRDASGRIARVRYVLPGHKAANWVGPGSGRRFHSSARIAGVTSGSLGYTKAGADPEGSHAPRRTARAAARLAGLRPANRLGRADTSP